MMCFEPDFDDPKETWAAIQAQIAHQSADLAVAAITDPRARHSIDYDLWRKSMANLRQMGAACGYRESIW